MSETLPSDPDELRAMIAALTVENARMTVEVERMTATPRAQDLLVQALQARIAKLQRQRSGPSSEKIEREIVQLDLALEDLHVAEGDPIPAADVEDDISGAAPAEKPSRPRRRPRVADGTPRERRVLDPGSSCPDCGGALRIVSEDVSERLESASHRPPLVRGQWRAPPS